METERTKRTEKNVIETRGISRVYSDDGVPVRALDGIDMAIEAGEFTAVVGPSGSGKTTLLNIISGLDKPTSGRVYLNGRLISGMSDRELSDFRRDNVGFIFQAYNLIPVLTVEENIEYVMLLQGIGRQEREKRVAEILAELDLAGFEKRMPPQLSGGQQQRVAVARAIVTRPALVLADEPTANLDSKTGAGLLDMMYKLNRSSGITFIFSTHDEMVMERAKRLITLKDGRIVDDRKN
jgi:putative ABC transport system ATP-binding protein